VYIIEHIYIFIHVLIDGIRFYLFMFSGFFVQMSKCLSILITNTLLRHPYLTSKQQPQEAMIRTHYTNKEMEQEGANK
jgi:hypothetical protein